MLDAPASDPPVPGRSLFPGAEDGCAGPGANAPGALESAVSLTGGSTTLPCTIFKSESDMIAAGVGCAVGCETVCRRHFDSIRRLNRHGRSSGWQGGEFWRSDGAVAMLMLLRSTALLGGSGAGFTSAAVGFSGVGATTVFTSACFAETRSPWWEPGLPG